MVIYKMAFTHSKSLNIQMDKWANQVEALKQVSSRKVNIIKESTRLKLKLQIWKDHLLIMEGAPSAR